MTVAEILNVFSCGLNDLLGAGLKACKFDLKSPATLYRLKKGIKYAPGTEINLEFINEQIQIGNIRVLQGVVDFADATPDNERITRASTGKMRTSLKHPYLLTFTFDNGIAWFKAVNGMDGNENADYWIADDAGNLLVSTDRQGNLCGLNGIMFETGKYLIGNENSQTVTIQIDRQSFDKFVSGIDAENLDFTSSTDVDDFNEVVLTIDPLVVGATTISFSAKLIDGTHNLEGLTDTDLLLRKTVANVVTTVPITGLVYNATTEKYTGTIASAVAGIYGIQTIDTTTTPDSNIIIVTGALYRGKEATGIVA